MLQKLNNHLAQTNLLPHGSRLILGVSGGVDSVVLLDALSKLQPDWDWQIVVAHLDHNVRAQASDDADFVARLSDDYGHKFLLGQLDGKSRDEASLRTKRYAFFDLVADGEAADLIVVAHHQDDLIETTMFNTIRGSDRRGLNALRPRRGRIARPMLGISRGEILTYAHSRNLTWREDASNIDPSYSRNALRHHVLAPTPVDLPHFRKQYLQELGNINRLDGRIDMALARVYDLIKQPSQLDGTLAISRSGFLKLSFEAQMAMLVWLIEHLQAGMELSQANLKATLRYMMSARTGSTANLISGLHIERSYDTFVLGTQDNLTAQTKRDPIRVLSAGQSVSCADRKFSLLAQAQPTAHLSVFVDPAKVYIRSFQAGDRLWPIGMQGSKKLSDIFTDRKVSRLARTNWPVVVNRANQIIWVPGLVADRKLTHDSPQGNYQLICEVI